jgi:hypothetical protein
MKKKFAGLSSPTPYAYTSLEQRYVAPTLK